MLHHFFMFEFLENNYAQIIGFVGLAFAVAAFQINDRTRIIIFQAASFFVFAVHFYLLGALSGAVLQLLGVLRNYFYVKYRNKYSFPIIPILFIMLFSLSVALTWEGLSSLLPMLGMIAGAVAFWQKDPKIIRRINLFGPPLWFIYSFINNSYSGMMVMGFIFASVSIAIIRYDILHKPEPALLKDKLKLVD